MNKEILFERAKPGDGQQIATLIEQCFPKKHRSLFIYGCRGAAQYADDCIRYQEQGSDSIFIVARTEKTGKIDGFVEIRRLAKNTLCLNYIATSNQARGQGICRRLMTEVVKLGQQEGFQRIVLDVFRGNTISKFYKEIGYQISNCIVFRAFLLPPGRVGRYIFIGLPQADTVHQRYGFSQFSLLTERRRYDIGRLGEMWFRSVVSEILNDEVAMNALMRLDPHRQLLVVSSRSQHINETHAGRIVLESDRLEGDISTVLPALEKVS